MSEEERLVVIRFGRDWDADCMRQDEVLYRIADRVKNFAVLYVCDLDQVPDFKQMYELYDPVTLMFFFRNKHMVRLSCCCGLALFPTSLSFIFNHENDYSGADGCGCDRCAISGRGIIIS